MKRKFSTLVLDHKGSNVMRPDGALTYLDLAVESLLTPWPGDPPDKKVPWFKFAMRLIAQADEAEITVEEASMLNARVTQVQPPLFAGRMDEFLNQE